MRPIFGFDQGFGVYVTNESRRMEEALDRALPWIEANRDASFFLLLHSYDVHSYRPPRRFADIAEPEYEGRLKELPRGGRVTLEEMVNRQVLGRLSRQEVAYLEFLYDTEIRVVDEQLQRLFSKLREFDLLERTAVLLTSDHGEALAEHGHDTGHADRLVIVEADDRDTQAAVVLDGYKYIDQRVVSHDPLDPNFARLMLRGIAWRRSREPALYDLRRDPGEQENLLRCEPERSRRYRDLLYSNLSRLRQWDGSTSADPLAVLSDLVEQLRSLGYVD